MSSERDTDGLDPGRRGRFDGSNDGDSCPTDPRTVRGVLFTVRLPADPQAPLCCQKSAQPRCPPRCRDLAFTLGISVLAGIAFGLVPGLHATRGLSGTLRDEAGAVIGGRRRVTLRGVLVSAQVALSLLLLVGSGLFLRSLDKARRIDPGFDTGPAAILWPQFEMSGIDEVRGRILQQQLAERLRVLPGVTGVAMAGKLPLGAAVQTRGINVDGVAPPPGLNAHHVDFVHVDGAYFDVMGVPIVSGRAFGDADTENTQPVAVVSETAARRFWPGRDAVGQTFWNGDTRESGVRVIGVARDTKVRTLGEQPRPYFYVSGRQEYLPSMMFVVRGTARAPELVAAAVAAAHELEPRLIILESKTMEQHLALMLYPPRMAALLLSIFGGLAPLLATIGLYGSVSYAVSRRTREVGIRAALGATRRDLVMMLTAGGLKLIVAGGAIGLALGAAAARLLARFLYGIGATDIVTFIAVPLLLGAVGFLASWLPARRAAGVDPLVALRAD